MVHAAGRQVYLAVVLTSLASQTRAFPWSSGSRLTSLSSDSTPDCNNKCEPMSEVGMSKFEPNASVPFLVLIPKCATTSMVDFMNNCSSGQLSPDQCINTATTPPTTTYGGPGSVMHLHCVPGSEQPTYTVIREPVERFISFVNYRLDEHAPRSDWVRKGLPWTTNITEAIDAMVDEDIENFQPQLTLTAYINEATSPVLCSIEEFASYIQQELGFSGCGELPSENPSSTTHGEPRPDQLARIERVLAADVELWQQHCGENARRNGGQRG